MSSDLALRSVTGATWSIAGKISAQLVSLCGILVAVRILSPRQFGILAVASLVGEFADVFRDLGTTAALIQQKEVSEELRSSVFWITQILSCLILATVYAISPFVADFYHDPAITLVLRVSSFCFILTSLCSVHFAILQRELQFRKVATIQFIGTATGTTVLIILALSGAGIWSVILSWIANFAAALVVCWASVRWHPRPVLAWDQVRIVRDYSLNLSATRLVEFFSRNADNAIVGRLLGLTALGYYQFAYNLILYSAQSISMMTSRVLFAALSQVQDDRERFRSGFIKSVSMLALLVFPLMLGIVAVADPFIGAIGGAKWQPAKILLVILAPIGLLQSVTVMTANIYSATGRTGRMFWWGLVTSTVAVTSFLAGLHWGIAGVAIAYLIANLLLFYPALALASQLIDLRVSVLLRSLWPALWISAAMAGSVALLRIAIRAWPPMIQLITLIPLGVLIYSALLWWIRPPAARDLFQIARYRRSLRS